MKSVSRKTPKVITFVPDSLDLEAWIEEQAKIESRSKSNWLNRQLTAMMQKQKEGDND